MHENWPMLYEAALVETDQSWLPIRLKTAREAIQGRLVELRENPKGSEAELQKLSDSLAALAVLAKER
jgi:hypothetical protein